MSVFIEHLYMVRTVLYTRKLILLTVLKNRWYHIPISKVRKAIKIREVK